MKAGSAITKQVPLRASPEQAAAWAAQARQEGLSLNAWAVRALDAAVPSEGISEASGAAPAASGKAPLTQAQRAIRMKGRELARSLGVGVAADVVGGEVAPGTCPKHPSVKIAPGQKRCWCGWDLR